MFLEFGERFLGSWGLVDLQHVEADSLGEGSAFSNSNNISESYITEAWGKMDRHVTVSLFKTVVFLDVVQVITTDDNSPLHLHFLDNSSQNTTTD